MGEDTALVRCTIEEFRYYRVIAPSYDPGIRAIPAEQMERPEDATFMDLFCSAGLWTVVAIKYV